MSAPLKPGYKQTEVGVIPVEWEVKRLGEIGTFSKGKGIRKDQIALDGLPCIRYGEIYTFHHDYIRNFRSFITPEVATLALRLRKGDLLFAGSGETAEEIGKCVAFLGDEEAYAGGDIVVLRPVGQDSLYLGYLMNHSTVTVQKAQMGQGDAVVHISAKNLAQIELGVPNVSEQTAIAAALSDVDALISAQDALIAKKRDIKQAAMQELLTGKRRLPGFSGEWEVKRLGEVLRVRHGKSQHDVEVVNGAYPILATGGEIGRTNHYLYDKPSVLIGRKGTIDAPQYLDTPFWTIDTLFFTEIMGGISAKFIFYKFNMINWRSYNEASGVPSLNASTIENVEIKLPNLSEQTAIATILSDMDAELASLCARRDKTRALKQGMMQELLTGRIRLV